MFETSVVIRNRNESEYIGFSIQSVIDHIKNPQIIIVDNNSVDNSLEIVNLFIDRVNIKIIKIQEYTPGKSINLGVQASEGENILVLSGHSQITSLDMIKVNNLLYKYAAVFGQQNPVYKGKKISKRYVWSHFQDDDKINMFSDIEKRYFLHNAFCFYRRSFLIDNPMPENLSGKEDRYWANTVVKKGLEYYYLSDIKCNHFYTGNGSTWKGLGWCIILSKI